MTEADALRSLISSALAVELEAGIAWTTLHDRLDALGTLVNQIEIQEVLETLPALRQAMGQLTALDAKLYAVKRVLEEVQLRL